MHLQPQLPVGPNGEPGAKVEHHFRASKIYCVMTWQFACGATIGWGKCYKSEGLSQIVALLNKIFPQPELRPSFIFYDNACSLLAHVVKQTAHNSWLDTTRFLCDAWHYINHRAEDALCRIWCNPAPADGSQPDLVIRQVDSNGRLHATRAFNTETAEQLNSWLSGYESAMKHMTDWNFDFFMHTIMLIYKEKVEAQIQARENEMEEVVSDDGID